MVRMRFTGSIPVVGSIINDKKNNGTLNFIVFLITNELKKVDVA